MSQPKYNRSNLRNLRSAGWTIAKHTGRAADKAAGGLFRWVTTDHLGVGRALSNMPQMGAKDTVRYVLRLFLGAIVGSLLGGLLIFLFIGFGIPFLITAAFS